MWFEKIAGFQEITPNNVRENLFVDRDKLISKITGKNFTYGVLETPSLYELRQRVDLSDRYHGQIEVKECVADVQDLHKQPENNGALFQVASQFNLLEMISPYVTPEDGVDCYEDDLTQGPACAIACGAGTIFRNYFVEINGRKGQSKSRQLDTLANIGEILNNHDGRLWKMINGYALVSNDGLDIINSYLLNSTQDQINKLKENLRVGIQWNTEVTISDSKNIVSQVYCSALPVAYSELPMKKCELFARLILESAYEATICTGILNYRVTGNPNVYLTLIGGGAFGNDSSWILNSIDKILTKYRYKAGLKINFVSYEASNHHVQKLVTKYSE